MSTIQENTQVIQKVYEAFGRGDVPTVLSYVAENATWVNPYGNGHFPGKWGKPARGHTEIAQFFQAINQAVEVQGFSPHEMIAQGDKVVVPIDWKGLIRRTGKPFQALLVHIWTLRNGKVVDYIGLDDLSAYAF